MHTAIDSKRAAVEKLASHCDGSVTMCTTMQQSQPKPYQSQVVSYGFSKKSISEGRGAVEGGSLEKLDRCFDLRHKIQLTPFAQRHITRFPIFVVLVHFWHCLNRSYSLV